MKSDEEQKKLEEKVDTIMKMMKKRNLEAETIQECVEGAVRVQLSEDKEEEEEKLKRKASVIVHGIEESKATESVDRVGDNKGRIASILQEIDCEETVIKQVIRLGKRQDGADGKARPIKLVLETEEAKQHVLLGAKNLKNKREGGLDKIFIHQDLTTKRKRSEEDSGEGTDGQEGKGRKGCDHCKWEDRAKMEPQRLSGSSVDQTKLKCFYTNANSLASKIAELKERVKDFDIIGIVETWANDENKESELNIDGYEM